MLLGVVATLVFVLLLAEVALVQLTSSLTLSILGILKEFATILLAGFARHEAMTPMKLGGVVVCSMGVLLYHVSKSERHALAGGSSGSHRTLVEGHLLKPSAGPSRLTLALPR